MDIALGDGRNSLLLELGEELESGGTISEGLWERLRGRWDDAELIRLLESAGVGREAWATWLVTDEPDAPPLRRRTVKALTVTLIASLGMFMAFIDHTVVGIAFPDLLRSFPDAGLGSLSWVISAYNIVFAALLVPAGRMADLLGRRRVFMLGIGLFTLASAACAAAPSVETLIAARALQALGAAIIVPASLALVLQAFPAERQAQGIAIWSASAAVASGLGPSVGGFLIELESWRLVFLVNLPVGIITWKLASTHLVESRAPGRRAMPDARGAVLLAVAVGALVLGLVQSESWGWASPGVIGLLLVAGVALGAFARRCTRHRAPVIDPALLRARSVAVASVLTLVGAIGFYGLSLSTVIWLMTVWGYTPLEAGLAMTPAPFAGALAAWLAGRWPAHRDVRPLIFLGGLVWCGGAVLLVRYVGTEPDFLGEWLPIACILAVGLGLTFPTVSTAAVAGASGERFATASAVNSTIRQLGAAIGVALFVVVLGQPGAGEAAAAFDRVWVVSAALFAAVAFGSLALGRLVLASPIAAPVAERPGNGRPRGRAQALPQQAVPDSAPLPQTPEQLLAEVPIFKGLEAEGRRAMMAQATSTTVLAGSWLFRQGDPADALFVVMSGRLEVAMERDGGEPEPIRELQRGAVLGELAIISGSKRSASVRARRDSELLRLDRADFEQLLAQQPRFAHDLLRHVTRMLETSRPATGPSRSAPATIAVVPLAPHAPAEALGQALADALVDLGGAALLDRNAFDARRDGGEPAAELARLLERCESEQGRVLLVASQPPGADPWTEACLRQADRVLAVVGDALPEGGSLHEGLRGCQVLVCGRPPADRLAAALDEIEPRSAHRLRGAGRSAGVNSIARRLAGRSVGLVLSGGGARALSHVGVIEELQSSGVVIDRIAGASMGAFVGAMAALGMDADEIDARCYEEWVRRRPLSDYRFPRTSLIRGERVRAMLERNLPGTIDELALPFWCVSADILSGELVVHRRGSLPTAVGGSMCLPVLAPPVVSDGRLLVDGGVLDNLPVGLMAEDAEGPIIASKANNSEAYARDPGTPLAPPPLAETLYRLILLGASDTVEAARRDAAVLITPDYDGVGMLEFHMLDSLRESGRRATAEALEHAPPEVFG